MTTPNEYARNATAALHEVLHIAPGDFDVDTASAVIEKAIRHATREQESRSRRQLSEMKTAAQRIRSVWSSPLTFSHVASLSTAGEAAFSQASPQEVRISRRTLIIAGAA